MKGFDEFVLTKALNSLENPRANANHGIQFALMLISQLQLQEDKDL